MYKLLTQKGQVFALVLGLVVIALFLGSVLAGLSSAGYSTSDDLNQIMKGNPDADFSFFNLGLALTMALIVIALVLTVLFGIFNVISDPKASMKAVIGLVAGLVLFFALYSISDTDFVGAIAPTLQKFNVSENVSKLISGGIKMTGFLALAAVVLMVVSEIRNLFK